MFTNVLPEHRPSKANTYSENKTHSHEGFKKEEKKRREVEREGGREGGRKRPLFFKLKTELDCGRQEDAKCTRPLSPQGAAWQEEEDKVLGVTQDNEEASRVEPDWRSLQQKRSLAHVLEGSSW